MPLYKRIPFNATTTIFVWKITESFDQLFCEVHLSEKSLQRLQEMKSQLHKRAFLSVRKLLQEASYTDFDLHYDAFGKPLLQNGQYISITHSHEFSAIIISNESVGIDIELQRQKIVHIASKFVNEAELSRLKLFSQEDYIRKLTVKWGAKEAIFKIRNKHGISFKDHIQVQLFEMIDKQTCALLTFENNKNQFSIYFEEIEKFILVYAFENH